MKLKKFIAIMLVIWLPLFSGDALAVAVSMEPGCQMHAMQKQSATARHIHDGGMSCHACGFCHLAGTGYLAVSQTMLIFPDRTGKLDSFYPSAYRSAALPRLDPPPLAVL